jgi:hypothetical protein
MTTLWRCDVCLELIDPVEGDDRAEIQLALLVDGGRVGTQHIDLCHECCPASIDSFTDAAIHDMEEKQDG